MGRTRNKITEIRKRRKANTKHERRPRAKTPRDLSQKPINLFLLFF